jgi:hypothetical protein
MREEMSSKIIEENFIVLISRIKPELKSFIPIISVGFSILLYTWEFPIFDRHGVVNTRVLITHDDRESLFYLMRHSRKSASEVISAALARAKTSKVRPHDNRRAALTRSSNPRLGATK